MASFSLYSPFWMLRVWPLFTFLDEIKTGESHRLNGKDASRIDFIITHSEEKKMAHGSVWRERGSHSPLALGGPLLPSCRVFWLLKKVLWTLSLKGGKTSMTVNTSKTIHDFHEPPPAREYSCNVCFMYTQSGSDEVKWKSKEVCNPVGPHQSCYWST